MTSDRASNYFSSCNKFGKSWKLDYAAISEKAAEHTHTWQRDNTGTFKELPRVDVPSTGCDPT